MSNGLIENVSGIRTIYWILPLQRLDLGEMSVLGFFLQRRSRPRSAHAETRCPARRPKENLQIPFDETGNNPLALELHLKKRFEMSGDAAVQRIFLRPAGTVFGRRFTNLDTGFCGSDVITSGNNAGRRRRNGGRIRPSHCGPHGKKRSSTTPIAVRPNEPEFSLYGRVLGCAAFQKVGMQFLHPAPIFGANSALLSNSTDERRQPQPQPVSRN